MERGKKLRKLLLGGAGAAALFAAGFGIFRMTVQNSKKAVAKAFESVLPSEQACPVEALFGVEELFTQLKTKGGDGALRLSFSESENSLMNLLSGSGFYVSAKNDIPAQKISAELGFLYKGMDVPGLQMYYGDENYQLRIPELSEIVLSADLGEGLSGRIRKSPVLGPLAKESGLDTEALEDYFGKAMELSKRQVETGELPFDYEALWERFREGSRAKERFEAAMTVKKGGKAVYTVDGEEQSCTGYEVMIEKDALIAFLRESSDFFLQDERLREDYLGQLQLSAAFIKIMGTASKAEELKSPEELREEAYQELSQMAEELIAELELMLSDVELQVYTDRKGRLASVSGSTEFCTDSGEVSAHPEAGKETGTESGTEPASGLESEPASKAAAEAAAKGEENERLKLDFSVLFSGGSYLTQNAEAELLFTQGDDSLKLSLHKKGSFDGNRLTQEIEAELSSPEEAYEGELLTALCRGNYEHESGAWELSAELGTEEKLLAKAEADGVIEELERGNQLRIVMERFELSDERGPGLSLSGELSFRPLPDAPEPLSGESMDLIGADEADWAAYLEEAEAGLDSLLSGAGF